MLSLLLALTAPRGARVFPGVTYRPGARGKLDVYAPRGVDGEAPTVVFFYGGGWARGHRAIYRFVGQVLAECGFVVVIPDYRVYPEVCFPAFVEDSAAATAWAKANIARYGGDPAKLFLMGHSAGAYNVAMLTLDRRWLREVGLDPRRDLRGAIGLAGPYDFLPLRSASLKAIFGPEDQWPRTQPIHHVDGQAPPMLLIAGRNDAVVDAGNSGRLAGRIRSVEGRVAEILYPALGHRMALGVLLPLFRFRASILQEVRRFIQFYSLEPATAGSGEV